MRTGLTRRQADLLAFIAAHTAKHGISPSFDEMREHLGLRSKSGIHRLIVPLERRGFIRRMPNSARAIVVVERDGFAPHIEAELRSALVESGCTRERFIEVAVAEFLGVST